MRALRPVAARGRLPADAPVPGGAGAGEVQAQAHRHRDHSWAGHRRRRRRRWRLAGTLPMLHRPADVAGGGRCVVGGHDERSKPASVGLAHAVPYMPGAKKREGKSLRETHSFVPQWKYLASSTSFAPIRYSSSSVCVWPDGPRQTDRFHECLAARPRWLAFAGVAYTAPVVTP